MRPSTEQVQLHFKGNYYIRYSGTYMACKRFDVLKKPSYDVVYYIEYIAGLWVLTDSAHDSIMNSFVLTTLLSFVYKKLK